MDRPLPFAISITDTEVLLRFDKDRYPTEVAPVEAAYQQQQEAQQTEDPHRIKLATIQLHQAILALLREPSAAERRARTHPRGRNYGPY